MLSIHLEPASPTATNSLLQETGLLIYCQSSLPTTLVLPTRTPLESYDFYFNVLDLSTESDFCLRIQVTPPQLCWPLAFSVSYNGSKALSRLLRCVNCLCPQPLVHPSALLKHCTSALSTLNQPWPHPWGMSQPLFPRFCACAHVNAVSRCYTQTGVLL